MLSKKSNGIVMVAIARQVRGETAVARVWIAGRLKKGSVSYLSGLLTVNNKHCPWIEWIDSVRSDGGRERRKNGTGIRRR
jgi:hypothetical protein